MKIDRGGRWVGRAARQWPRAIKMMLVASLALASACSLLRNEAEEVAAEPQAPTRLRVDNQAFLDMTIYVYRNSQRVRLGTATGNSVTRLTIPANMIFGSTPLRFQADPIGGNRTPISSEITVSPGDEVVLTIPPNT
jgi:hypothetical protein